MRKNTLFHFIVSKQIAMSKQDKEGRAFALIPLSPTAMPAPYQLKEHHFTIFSGYNEAHNSEFHYTANMLDEHGETIKVHVFFDHNHKQTGNITFAKVTALGSERMEMHEEAIH